MDTIEEYEIYKAMKTTPDNILNDKLTFKSNKLFDTAIKLNSISSVLF